MLLTTALHGTRSSIFAHRITLYSSRLRTTTNHKFFYSTMTQKPILISGAGLASLLLAQSLKRASIPFQIFERDANMSARAQGYRLRLSTEGLVAIEAALGPESFKKFWATCGKTAGAGVVVLDAISGEEKKEAAGQNSKPGSGLAANSEGAQKSEQAQGPSLPKEHLTSGGGQTVGISRGDMRRLFMSGCEEMVRWSHHVVSYELTKDGVRAVFADGSKSEEGAMLVGGEGIYSKVAKQLSDGVLKTFDTGARGIHGQAPTTAFKQLGEGVWRIVDDSRDDGRVFVITNVRSGDMDNADMQFGWTLGAQPGVIQVPGDNYTLVGTPAADIAKSLTAKWHSLVRPLFDNMVETEAAFWKITCSTPSGVPEWKNQPRVTVIGDAVHSMTPAGGIGANTAVRDSELLGRLLTEAGGYREGITNDYERQMRVYASEAVAKSYGMAEKQFGIKIDEKTSLTV